MDTPVLPDLTKEDEEEIGSLKHCWASQSFSPIQPPVTPVTHIDFSDTTRVPQLPRKAASRPLSLFLKLAITVHFIFCGWLFLLHVCLCTIGGQKRVSDPPEL